MHKFIFTAIALLFSIFVANAGKLTDCSFIYNDSLRTYTMFMPDSISPAQPLIVYTHGYGSRTHTREDLHKAAEKSGYAVCSPDGATDSKGKPGWNVGYPSQFSMAIDEADFMDALLNDVCQRFSINRENVFLTGMSNGGDLCYHLMYTRPGLFKAYASVAGLTFNYVYHDNHLSDAVPFMEIHGTADKTSMWDGDPENTGGWGAYIPVPLAVAAIAANNKCTGIITEQIEPLPGSEHKITKYTYTGSPTGATVELYQIHGGKHSWANKDIDTSMIICDFFTRHLH